MIERNVKALKIVFGDRLFLALAVSLALNLLAVDYFVFSKSTSFAVFLASNSAFYNWTSLVLTVFLSLFFGVAVSLLLYVLRQKQASAVASTGNSLLGGALGVVSSGCPVCGAWLLPALGIAGSLAAFPLQGLEIKLLSIFLLGFSISESGKSVLGMCSATGFRAWLRPIAVAVVALLIVYTLPQLPPKYKLNFARKTVAVGEVDSVGDADAKSLVAQINPSEGYRINATYGDLGPKILASGAIDYKKLKSVYDRSGQPLTASQTKILKEGLDEKITIKRANAHFLLNFFWALGLANKNPLLLEGPIAKYGEKQIGSFASTGGWTLGETPTMEFYSQSSIVTLTPKQQAKVEEVAGNVYRPCCGNATSFPDCNHGMALLAVLELMAANDASTDEMFEAAKYFNAFWFPQQYLDLATYFKAKEGKDFGEVDAKLIVGADYSSGRGWSRTKKWLAANNLVEKAPGGGGGCGV